MEDMNIRYWLRHAVQIARIERTRTRRQLARSSAARTIIAIVLVSIAGAAGISAYIFGTMLQSGQVTLPVKPVQIATTVGFLGFLVGFTQQTSKLVERLNTDHLLTTVPARAVVLGVVLAVSRRDAIRIFVIAVSVAVGFAFGTQSLASVFTILVAVAGFVTLVVMVGVTFSFAIEFLTTRSPRFRRYKNAFAVMGFILLLIGWTIISSGLLSVDFTIGWLSVVPTAWFVNLALLGVPAVQSRLLQSLGALGLIVIGIPILMITATILATRVWETEPVSAAILHRSHSLVGDGFAERLFAGFVSRPVLTVARKRWLQERRVPTGLFMAGTILIMLPFIYLFIYLLVLADGMVPVFLLVVFIFCCAASTGLAFGLDTIETEYSSLSMTFTTISGQTFIQGTILAGIAIGAPVTVVATIIPLLGSSVGILETLLFALFGVALCVCGVTLATAIGMTVSYRDLVPISPPFTSARMYSEIGLGGFIRMGTMLGLLGLVCLPAFGGYLLAFVNSTTLVFGIPTVTIRISSLTLTIILAAGVSVITYRRAVWLYDQYMLS